MQKAKVGLSKIINMKIFYKCRIIIMEKNINLDCECPETKVLGISP